MSGAVVVDDSVVIGGPGAVVVNGSVVVSRSRSTSIIVGGAVVSFSNVVSRAVVVCELDGASEVGGAVSVDDSVVDGTVVVG